MLPKLLTNSLLSPAIALESLRPYFSNLEAHLPFAKAFSDRKYAKLSEGLYILLHGKLSYSFTGGKQPVAERKGNSQPRARAEGQI
jgi:hypothetical protein